MKDEYVIPARASARGLSMIHYYITYISESEYGNEGGSDIVDMHPLLWLANVKRRDSEAQRKSEGGYIGRSYRLVFWSEIPESVYSEFMASEITRNFK